MQIPSGRSPFKESTIVVVVAEAKAKLYQGDEQMFHFLEELRVDDSFEKGGEGHAMSQPGITGAPAYDTDRMHWESTIRKQLGHKINAALKQVLETTGAMSVRLCLPSEHKNELIDVLDTEIVKKITKIISKNFYQLDEARLFEALTEA